MPNLIELEDKLLIDVTNINSLINWILDDPSFAAGTASMLVFFFILASIRDRLGNSFVNVTDKVLSHLTVLAIQLFSHYSFGLRYKKHIINEHRVFNVRGLRTQGTFTLEAEKIYVNLKISQLHNPNKHDHLLHQNISGGSKSIWEFLRDDIEKIFAVIGAPGCGKTTLLQHIALTLAANKHLSQQLPAYTPVFLFLREHIDAITSNEAPNLADLTQDYIGNTKRYPNLNPPDGWFSKKLSTGKAIVLLDGLDEVADNVKRKQVSEWLDRQIVIYHQCPFIVTSRPRGYLTAPLSQAHRLEIQPFSWRQVKEFADNWYLQNEILSFGKKDDGVIQRALEGANNLLNRLQKMPRLKDLTVNPLLLTMIAMVHRYRGQLPGRRIELYSEICDVLLDHWRAARGIKDYLTAAQKRVAIQPLAASMMINNKRDIATADAIAIISAPLREVGLSSDQAGEQFLQDLQAGSGLLNEAESHEWSFAHFSIQEYLAACDWIDKKPDLNWRNLVNESWWHETIKLYAAQTDASMIVEACLLRDDLQSLTLAYECVEEALKLDEETRRKLINRFIGDLESSNLARKKLAAEAKLVQRLKKLDSLNDNTDIDNSFITCAEYQLFLEEMGLKFKPVFWKNDVFTNGSANFPILGISGYQAEEFCRWLSDKTGEKYRLPTPDEMQLAPSIVDMDKETAAWCRAPKQFVLYWQNGHNKYLKEILSLVETKPELTDFFLFNESLLDEKHLCYAGSFFYSIDFDRTQVRTQSRNVDLDLDLDCDRDLHLAKEISQIFDMARYSRLKISKAIHDHEPSLARDIVRVLSHDLVLYTVGDENLTKDFSRYKISQLKDILKKRLTKGGFIDYFMILLDELEISLTLEPVNSFEICRIVRKIIILEMEYCLTEQWPKICEHFANREFRKTAYIFSWEDTPIFSFKLRHKPGLSGYEKIDSELMRDIILAVYWQHKIIDSRIEGLLPVWEGIRIVRDRQN